MKKIIQAGLLIMCFLLAGCGSNEDKEELTIKVNNNNIKYLLTSEPFTTGEDLNKAYLQIDNKELVYAPRDSKVSIDLNGGDEIVSIKAYWIDKEGFPNYKKPGGEPLDMNINMEEKEDSKYEFTVERLFQAALSSYYEENEKITAGYVIELQKVNEVQYCYFMLKIDKN